MHSQVNVLLHVLLALAAIVIVGRVLGRLLRPLGQPQVIADILAGILLGPSLIGREAAQALLPPAASQGLGLVAQVGIILWMFLLGLETNLGMLRGKWRPIVSIAGSGMIVPFALGWILLAGWLHPRYASPAVDPTHFALFIGVALSITAFPVLARILADRNLQKTSNGMTALACAALGDVAAWCILAMLVGIVQMKSGGATILLATLAFVATMLIVVRPILHRWAVRQTPQQAGNGAITIALLGTLLCAATTEWIGIHALFGAFLFGLIIPHDCVLAETLERRIRDVVSIVFLPAFFAYAGLRTEIGLVETPAQWLAVGAIILVATLGKFGGVTIAARLNGFGWRDSAILGSLMNSRGLVELIVLNIGLDVGVISPTVYTMMVLMALATTIGTAPMIRALGVRSA